MFGIVNPPWGKTTDRRAGCGKSARPVRREGGLNSISPPYPYPATDRQIDRMVYELYGLNEAEIAIVEEATQQ